MAKKAVYTLEEVGKIFGITEQTLNTIKKKKRFDVIPFSIIEMNDGYYCPKKQVDNFIKEGKKPHFDKKMLKKEPMWVPGQYTTWTYNIPKELSERFKKMCMNINKHSPVKISIQQYRCVAIQEFIDRRPEYLVDEGGEGEK